MVIQPPSPQITTRRPFNARPPTFEKPPVGGRFIEGGDAHFECRVQGNPPPEVVWTRRGMPIRNDNRRQSLYNPDTGMCTLHITGLTPDDDGDYTCTAVNCAGEASLTVTIQREVQPRTFSQTMRSQQMETRTVTDGSYQEHVSSTYVQSHIQRQYESEYQQQYESGYQQLTSNDYDGESIGPFFYSGADAGFRVDTFEYRLLREVEFRESVMRRQYGETEIEVKFELNPKLPPSAPQILQRPRNSKLLEGSDATFQAHISGNPSPRITWFRNGIRIVPSKRSKMTYTDNTATLYIHMALPEDAGYYTMLADNPNGLVACSAELVIEGAGTVPEPKYAAVQKTETTAAAQQKIDSIQTNAVATTPTIENGFDENITRSLKPNFVKVPTDKEVFEMKLVRFDCRVTGRPYPEVLWYHNGQPLLDDATHKLLVNEGGIHSLMITVASRTDAGTYTCIAKNKSGEARFDVNLTVIEIEQVVPPKFVERFQTTHVRDGESLTLHCRAVGTPVPHMTWQKDGVQIHSRPPDLIIETQEGSSTLYFNRVLVNDAGWYQCTAQNQAGSTATRARLYVNVEHAPASEPWRLHLPRPHKVIEPEGSPPRETIWLRPVERSAPYVPPAEEPPPPQKPAFTTHPRDLQVHEGEKAHFDARLIPIGDPTMNIEWFVNGRPLTASSRVTTLYRFGYVALTLLHVYPEDSGVYTCRATNEAGEATTTATLKCSARAAIEQTSQHPESMDAIRHLEDYEHYKRQVSTDEMVSVQKPTFIKPLNNLENMQEGGYAHFEGQLTPVNDPTMKIEWFFNGQPLTAGTRISTMYSFGYVSLNITYLRAEDSGVYMCKASNQKGEAMSTATLKVKVTSTVVSDLGFPEQERYIEKIQQLEAHQYAQSQKYVEVETTSRQKPCFKTQLQDLTDLQEGKTAHFEASLEPQGDITMRVEWLKDGKPLEAGSRTTTFFNFGYVSLTIRGVEKRDVGIYTCRATNSLGSAESSAKLSIIEKTTVVVESQHPEGLEKIQHLEDSSRYERERYEETVITKRPTFTMPLDGKENLVEGQCAHFETRLEPMGDPTMVVEWYFNGFPLTTGHRFKTYYDFGYVALDILYVFPEDTGVFVVKAKNAMGETSLSKKVTVQAKSAVDTSIIHHVGYEKIEQLERTHQEPRYDIEEVTKIKPRFTVPLQDPPPLQEGQRVLLECRVEPVNDPTMKVEWYFNGRPLQSGSRFITRYDFGYISLEILQLIQEDSGEYTVRVSNILGSAHSSSCVRIIGKSGVISDTQHPEGMQKIRELEDHSRYQREVKEDTYIRELPTFTKLLHNIDTIEGTNIHLECRLTPVSDPTMKVEWFVNGQTLKIGHRFRPSYEFDYVALDILSVYPEDSGVYTCKARNSAGEAVTSCSVKILAKGQIILETQHPEGLMKIQHLESSSRYQRDRYVEETTTIRPRFLTELSNISLREGQVAHFECRLEPVSDPTLKVEWFHNGRPVPAGHRYRPLHDFGYVALSILSVVVEDSGTYTCRATNSLGIAEISATLSCQGKSSILLETQHPTGLQRIQELEDHTRYTRERYEEETITQIPVFKTAPRSVEIREGEAVHFECTVIPVGDPTLKIEWFHEGKPIKTGSRFVETCSFGYVALDIKYAYTQDAGKYTCRASNSVGQAITSCILKCVGKSSIVVEPQQPDSIAKIQQLESYSQYQTRHYDEEITTEAPVFTQPMRNLRLQENQTAHFECRLIPVGDPKLKVEWYHNGRPLMKANRVNTTHDFGYVSLDIAYVKLCDIGTYTCKATNDLGQAMCSATLEVKGSSSIVLETHHPEGLEQIQHLEDSSRHYRSTTEEVTVTSGPVFVTPLRGTERLVEGQNCHMECRIEPYPDPTMKVEWFFNGRPLPTGHRFRTRYDFGFAALEILGMYPEDAGEYMIRATNQLGSSFSVLRVTVTAKSSLILESQQPDSLYQIQRLEDMSHRYQPTFEETIVIDRPAFGQPLPNLELMEGARAHLETTLTPINDPTMKVEWFFNGRPIQQGHRFKTVCDFGYVAMDILHVYAEDTGTYMCKATNKNGEAVTTCSIKVTAKSSIITETLHEEGLEKIRILESTYTPKPEEIPFTTSKPVFTKPLVSQQKIKESSPVHLECRLEPINDPKLKVEWFVNGVEIRTGHRFRTTHDFGYVALDILYAYPEDSGTYMCKATNELGEAVTTCSIEVQSKRSIYYETQHPEGLERIRQLECQTRYAREEIEDKPSTKPYFTSEMRGTTELTEGQSAHIEGRVEPTHDPDLKIEFFHNGKPLIAGSRFHITFDFGYVALDIMHVLPQDAGTYTVKAINKLGEAVSSIDIKIQGKSDIILDTQHPEGLAKIQQMEATPYQSERYTEVKTFQRPVFTSPLQNLDSLYEGEAAHLECRLIPVGDPTLKVEWFFNDKPLGEATRFRTIHDFGYVSLDIQYLRPDDTGIYMCRASNELGEAVTTASIKVISKASIISDSQHPGGLEKIRELETVYVEHRPEAVDRMFEKPVFTTPLVGPNEIFEGQPAHFECRAIPVGDPDLRFEWFVNGVELKKGSRFKAAHDFGYVSLDISTTIPEDSGVYMCRAVNKAGEAVTTTSLKVTARSSILTESQHPESIAKTAQFELGLGQQGPAWTEETLAQMPVFTQHLVSHENLVEGQYIRLEGRVEPINDEKLRIEWYKNGKSLIVGTRITTRFDFGLVVMDIVGVRPDDAGIYTCRAVNEVGEAISTCTLKIQGHETLILGSQHPESLAKIQELEAQQAPSADVAEPVYEVPVFISHLNNLELHEGETAHFECRVEPARDPTLKIEFLVNGKPLTTGTRFTMINDFGFVTLDITKVVDSDAGIYTCRATNSKGQATTNGSLKVHAKDAIIYTTQHPMGEEGYKKVEELERSFVSSQQITLGESEKETQKPFFVVPLNPNFTVNEGNSLRIECRVEPSTDPHLHIEWFFNGKILSQATRFKSSCDFGYVYLECTDWWPRDNGVYTCRAYNKVGEAFTTTTIQCISKDTIYEGTLHPEGQKGLESIQELEDSFAARPSGMVSPTEEGQPPVFTSEFQSLTNLSEGETAHFEATLIPVGDQTMIVEWFFNGQPLKAGSRIRTIHAFGMVILEIMGLYIEDSGEYICRATNKWGRAETSVTLECVEKSRGQRPQFITQLQSMLDLKEGNSAHFECNLIPVGDPTMRVEWYHNGVPMRHSSRIKTLSDFGLVLMDIAFVHVEDSGEYVCVATNKYGSDTTRCTVQCTGYGKIFRDTLQPQSLEKIAELEGSQMQYRSQISIDATANQPPHFETQIQSITTLVEGQSAHFEARLIPVNDPNLKVEWFFNGKPLRAGHKFRTFHDFGIVILDILYCYAEDSGEYVCKATNRYGSDMTKATLSCKSKSSLILTPQLPPQMAGGNESIMALEEAMYRTRTEITEEIQRQPPRFTKPLENITNLREGENIHLEARLIPIDDPRLKVEWFKDDKPLRHGTRMRTIHDFGFVVLEISPAYPEDSGFYLCRARNDLGEAVTSCTIKCEGKRSIIFESQLPEGMEGSIDKIALLETYPDARPPEPDDENREPPLFLSKPDDLILPENSLAHFECRLTPMTDPTLRVEWYHNGKPLVTGSRVRTISDFGFVILEIAGVYPRDAGVYTCRSINKYGEASVSANLTVKSKHSIILEPQLPQDFKTGTESIQRLEESLYKTQKVYTEEEKPQPPHFITQIQDLLDKTESESARFECRLEPVGDPTMKVEWFLNGKPLTTGTRVHTVDDFGFVVLEIDWLFPRDAGEYLCRATNKWGSDTTKAVLKVKAKKDIILDSQLPEGMSADKLKDLEYQPSPVTPMEEEAPQPPKFTTQIQPLENLQEGDSAHFECRLIPINDPKLRVEWYHNGKPLRSGHRYKTTHDFGFVALDVLYVYAEDSGEYTARAVNDYGEDITRTTLRCRGKPSLDYRPQIPKEMEPGVQKIAEMEASWQRAESQEEVPQEKSPPMFIMKPEPQVVVEGEWAKFCCRVIGYPKPRLIWVLNGNEVIKGSRYKLTYDGIYHFDIPKSRQYDQGKVEVFARNICGEAYCWTTLEVRPRHDDYRLVLKRSPRPWYDNKVKSYQRWRQETEVQDFFEEKLTPGGTKINVWKTEEGDEGDHVKVIETLEEEELKKLQPEVKRYKSETFYVDEKTGEKKVEEGSQVQYMAKTYESQIELPVRPMTFPESMVHGKEVHVSTQKQTQKEVKGDLEITRKTTVKETMAQEHKGVTVEKKVRGPVPETKPPMFTKKIQPCRVFEGECAKFECTFTGYPPPHITWFRENFPITSSQDFQIATTDTTSTLTIREVYLEDSGVFSVKAENRGGTAKSSANLVVEERRELKSGIIPPSFVRTIQDCTVKVGQLVRLDAQVTGSKPLDVFWLKNGKKIIPDITHKMIEEEDTNTLLVLEASTEDSGTYECVALNQAGEARCQASVLVEAPKKPRTFVREPSREAKPAMILEPLKDTVVKEGQPAVFQCRISGTPVPTVRWFRGSSLVKQSRYFRMSSEKDMFILRISEAFPEDEAVYKCVASNPAGTVATTANLKVVPEAAEVPPALSPLADLTVPEGAPARFVTSVTGTPTPKIIWCREGAVIKQSRDFQMNQDAGSCSLLIRQTYPEDEGVYTCRATNASGQAETSARLTVESKH